MAAKQFIACGMYATRPELQQAWQQVFDQFYKLIDTQTEITSELVFDGAETVLRDPDLFLGHTCGYPLMTSLQDQLRPFCVPLFDVEGCDGKLYSSQFIVVDDSSIRSLGDCRGTTVAVNHMDSNSGMNVLRYELAKLGAGPGFFNRVEISGGHWKSITAVAQGSADVAAIDCVSWQLALDFMPQICCRIRIIGHSVKTAGLPFVIPHSRYRPDDCRLYIKALNQALARVPQASRECLHLSAFEAVEVEHYETILEFKNYAFGAGYAELN